MKNIILLICVLVLSCRTTQPGSSQSATSQGSSLSTDVIKNYDELSSSVGKQVILEGKMIMEKFVNKAGKESDFYEFWLEMKNSKNETQLVMLRNKGEAISKEPITKQVHITGILFHGNIDNDDPKVQSRVGYRLDYTAIKIIAP